MWGINLIRRQVGFNMWIGDKIVEVAERFEGLAEVVQNTTWDDPKTKGLDARAQALKEALKRVGHENGWAYCMTFAEVCWRVAYEEVGASKELIARIAKLLTPSVVVSMRNVKAEGLLAVEPKRGSIMFMQKGTGAYGHAGVVTGVQGYTFFTIEGNTGGGLENREGDGIYRKKRMLFYGKSEGLVLRGFLNPIHV